MTRFLDFFRTLFRFHKRFPENRIALVGLHMNAARKGTGR